MLLAKPTDLAFVPTINMCRRLRPCSRVRASNHRKINLLKTIRKLLTTQKVTMNIGVAILIRKITAPAPRKRVAKHVALRLSTNSAERRDSRREAQRPDIETQRAHTT